MTTEDTQQTEHDATLEQMLQDAEQKTASGEVVSGTVVHKGGDESPAPMIISSITHGDKVKVYDTITGEDSWVLYNPETGGLLRQVLRRKRPDGSRMFDLKPPLDKMGNIIRPVRGIHKCLLHKDGPNREHYNQMGLPVCNKDNITAPYMVEKHMKNRHPTAWGIIERERQDAEKKEDRDFQRGIIEMAAGRNQEPKETFSCSMCDKKFGSRIALEGHKRSHK